MFVLKSKYKKLQTENELLKLDVKNLKSTYADCFRKCKSLQDKVDKQEFELKAYKTKPKPKKESKLKKFTGKITKLGGKK